MRKSTIIRNWLFGMALFAMPAMAQDVPNGDFSSWEDRSLPEAVGDGSYSRPTGGWDCLNSLAPGSCTKTEGRTAGSSAALLTTKKFMVNMGSGPTVFVHLHNDAWRLPDRLLIGSAILWNPVHRPAQDVQFLV